MIIEFENLYQEAFMLDVNFLEDIAISIKRNSGTSAYHNIIDEYRIKASFLFEKQNTIINSHKY